MGIEALFDKLSQARSETSSGNSVTYDEVLRSIAMHYDALTDLIGRPSDPIWDQYTYDEIIGMADDGVNVPDDILAWANSMADANTELYEIDDSASTDSNTASNLELGTNDSTKLGQQQKLQKFSSKADAQDELLNEKNDELQQQGMDLEAAQNDLEAKQKLTLDKVEQFSQEFKSLNAKMQKGGNVSENEINRYKELGMILNTAGQELIAQTQDVEADLENLLSQMSEIDDIINVNDSISSTIERLSLSYSGTEGGKNYGYTGKKGSFSFGSVETYAYMALGRSTSLHAGVIGINLHNDTEDLQAKLNANASIADVTMNKIQSLESKDDNITPAYNTQNITTAPDNNIDKSGANSAAENNAPANDEQENTTAAEISAETETEETGETETEEAEFTDDADDEETAVREYADNCASKSSEMQAENEILNNSKSEIESLKQSKSRDTKKAEKEFETNLKKFEKLRDKINGKDELSDEDLAEYERLSAVLDSETGDFAMDTAMKTSILDEFTTIHDSLLKLSEDNETYGDAAVMAGKAYAMKNRSNALEDSLIFMDKEAMYDYLYGKSGSSVGRDAIDNGEALMNDAAAVNQSAAGANGLSEFASEYSSELTANENTNNAKVTSVSQNIEQSIKSKTEGNTNSNSTADDSVTSASSKQEKEEASQDDVDNVEKKGKAAEEQANEAKEADQEAVTDKKKCEQDIKKNTRTMKETQRKIQNLTKANQQINTQILQLTTQAEGEIQSLGSNSEDQAQAAPAQQSMNAGISMGGNGISNNSGSSSTSDIESKIANLDSISQHAQKLGKVVTTNGRTINLLQAKTVKTDKDIQKASRTKYKIAVAEQKEKQQEIKANQELTGTISKIGQVFTATKLAGLALMCTPWGAAAGLVMFNIGKYGEIASYLTNAAINVAQGNLLGAVVNIGAAALSFLSAPPASAAGTEAVKEGAKGAAEGATQATVDQGALQLMNEEAKQFAENLSQESMKNLTSGWQQNLALQLTEQQTNGMVNSTITNIAQQALTTSAQEVTAITTQEIAKETLNTAIAGTSQAALTESAQASMQNINATIAAETAKQEANAGFQSAFNAAIAGSSEAALTESAQASMQAVSEQISANFAKQFAKKEMMQNLLNNGLLEVAKQTLLTYGEKLQQKDTNDDNNKKTLRRFDMKRRAQIKKRVEEIRKTMYA